MIPDHLGPYRIERLLGTGGMGAVYAGRNDTSGEVAAIKVLAPAIAADENFRARFETEIETLKKLRHPHIVQLYGYGEHDGQLFYSMELVEGSSLQEKLKDEGPLPWRQVVSIGIDVAMALKHAHDRGIIHRDLKPANLLIDPSGQVKLTDFGIAKLFGGNALTAAGGVMGTADFMAPEQADGQTVSYRVDLYSLGGVLYALLTGRPPFLGNSLVEVLDMLKHDKPTPISRLMPKIPRALDAIVLQLLEKNPRRRIPTALAAANQLRSLEHALAADKTQLDDQAEARDRGDFRIAESPTEVTPPSAESAKIASKETAFVPAPERTSPGKSSTGKPAAEKPTGGKSARQAQSTDGDSRGPGEPAGLGRFRAEYYDEQTAGEAPTSQAEAERAAERSRFTSVSPEDLGRDDRSQFDFDDDAVGWPRVAALAIGIVVLAVAGWYTLRPPSADSLWSRIEDAATADDPQQLYEADEQIAQFLSRYPDHAQADQVRRLQEEIELMRLERRLQRRLRRGADPQSIGATEQLYLDAMSRAASDPHEAASRLESLVALYEADARADAETQQVVDLARRQLKRLEPAVQQAQREHLALLDERLKFAASLARSDSAAARPIYRAVVTLYADKPWAARFVAIAREALARPDADQVQSDQAEDGPE